VSGEKRNIQVALRHANWRLKQHEKSSFYGPDFDNQVVVFAKKCWDSGFGIRKMEKLHSGNENQNLWGARSKFGECAFSKNRGFLTDTSYLSCLAKKGNPKKSPPVCRPCGVPSISHKQAGLRNSP
jgi:hypothetical protein